LLYDDNVDIPFIDLDEYQRELCRLEKGRAIAALPGPSPTRDRDKRRRDFDITPVVASHLGDFDRFEVDLIGFRQHKWAPRQRIRNREACEKIPLSAKATAGQSGDVPIERLVVPRESPRASSPEVISDKSPLYGLP
jgi:hypothetical protein